jgi:phosphoribosylanthranilate isomerase
MNLKTNIKLGEVNNLSDARYAAGLGAQFLGFNFCPTHPQYLAPSSVQEIVGWLTGPCLVGEWEDELADIILDTTERLHLDYAQLNSFDPAKAKALKDICLIQNMLLDENSPAELIRKIDEVHTQDMYFLLSFGSQDAQTHYFSHSGNQQLLRELCRDYPVILNFYFSPENAIHFIEEYKPFGINLKGSSEIKPGYKDFDELNELVSLLEIE